MKAFKGFNPDLTCRGFQYAEGGAYETDTADLCHSGFHAVEAPLDVFGYYSPAESVYRVVELDGVSEQREGDSKVAARKIRIGATVSLAGLAQAHVELVSERIDRSVPQTVAGNAATNTGGYSAATNTGHGSAATNTGDCSAATVEGAESIAVVTGRESRAAGAAGCWIVLTERDTDGHILGVKAVKVGSRVNSVRIEPGVFYELRDGKVRAVTA